MADLDDPIVATNFGIGRRQEQLTGHIKGASQLDFGMQHRLSRIFAQDGRTVMLAFDHGYFQGPTSGLERIDLNVVPLAEKVDALMATRGVYRSLVPAHLNKALVVRASGGPSVLKELSNERIAMNIEDAVRVDAAAVAVQVFVGGEGETQSVHNMTRLVDDGLRAGIPVLGVTAVGREISRDARYLGLATRMIAELGAQLVKTYYCEEDFAKVTSACPVPIIVAGGKKISSAAALSMARRAVDEGAAGVDMGRNIFQRENPTAMVAAVDAVVHDGLSAKEGAEMYRSLSNGAED